MCAQLFEEKTIKREVIFEGQIIDLVKDEVLLPNGAKAFREIVLHRGAVAILALTDDERMVFVEQFRKPLEKTILEIPAGKIDAGEERSPEETARRELEEEAYLRAKDWQFVQAMYMTPGFANEQLFIYAARGLEKVAQPLARDADEFITLHYLTFEEAQQAIAAGTICDAKTLFAVQYWELLRLQARMKEEQA